MKCLRCGYCCKQYDVIIVDDPSRGPSEHNLAHKPCGEPCKHLQGAEPGTYACALHDEPWYDETPCFHHGQIEQSPDDDCRMGAFVLARHRQEGSVDR